MIPKFKAALFDMDGTLLATMRYWRLTTIEVLLAHDILPSPEIMSRVFETSSRKLTREVFDACGLQQIEQSQLISEMEGFMHRHYLRDAHAKPGVRAYLQKLRDAGIEMCVATGSPREYAGDALDRLELSKYFSFITDSYEYGMDKHEPAYFELMAQKLGVKTGEMCVFEDAPYSVRAAKAAGCKVIAIRDQTQKKKWPELEAMADHTIDSFEELMGCN